jgi:hypothetical protein
MWTRGPLTKFCECLLFVRYMHFFSFPIDFDARYLLPICSLPAPVASNQPYSPFLICVPSFILLTLQSSVTTRLLMTSTQSESSNEVILMKVVVKLKCMPPTRYNLCYVGTYASVPFLHALAGGLNWSFLDQEVSDVGEDRNDPKLGT